MLARFAIFSAAALTITAAAAGEPPKAPIRNAAQPQRESQEVVLASADDTHAITSTPDQGAPTAVKRPRVARVTTCRCGDPEAQPEQ